MTTNMTIKKAAVAVAIAFALQGVAQADNSSGSIVGQAKPSAKIELVSTQTGLKRTVVADAAGRYRIAALPVGTYTLSSDGEKKEVKVNLGVGTMANFSGDTEVISVTGHRISAIDTTTIESTSVFTSDELARLPTPRNLSAVALLAPGTVLGDPGFANQQSNNTKRDGFFASFGGASVAENAYFLNGFDITNARTLLGFATLPFDAIAQQQVKTGGYGVEYGRSLGGVINVVTKKGTNEWEFGASAYIAPKSWQSRGKDAISLDDEVAYKYQAFRSKDTADTQKYVLQAGGPLIQDTLFIYSAVELNQGEWNDYSNGDSGNNTLKEQTSSPRGLVKIDWNMAENHLLEFTGLYNKRKIERFDYKKSDPDTAFDGQHGDKPLVDGAPKIDRFDGGHFLTAKYTGILTDDLTVSATVGRLYGEEYDEPGLLPGAQCPRVWDGRAGGALVYRGCWVETQVDIRDPAAGPNSDERVAFRADAEYRLGDHTIRAGLDLDEWTSFAAGNTQTGVGHNNYYYRYYKTGPNGGTVNLVNLPANTEYIRTWDRGTASAEYKVKNSAFYIEDKWQVTDQWMVYAGLRSEGFENTNADGVNFVEADSLAPRGGFSFDPYADGKTKVFGSLGRYYIPVAANTNIRAAGIEWFDTQYWLHTSAEDPTTGAPVKLGPQIGNFIAANREAANPATIAATNLSTMFQDELILGLQTELSDNWTGGIKYVRRIVGDGMDDYCSQQAFVDWAEDKGYENFDYHSMAHCIILNPGRDLELMVDINNDGKLVPSVIPNTYLKLPKYERTYEALEFTLGRAKADNWYMQASYLLSFNKGNAEGYVNSTLEQDDAGLTQDFDHERFMTNTDGYLPNDRRHAFKIFGGYDLTDEWSLSATLNVTSGRPVNCNGYIPLEGLGIDQSNLTNYAASSFYCLDENNKVQPTKRGQYGRTPWTKEISLSVSYVPDWAQDKLDLQLSVTNLLNSDTVTKYQEIGDYSRNDTRRNPNFLTPFNYQAPRTVELIARYSF